MIAYTGFIARLWNALVVLFMSPKSLEELESEKDRARQNLFGSFLEILEGRKESALLARHNLIKSSEIAQNHRY